MGRPCGLRRRTAGRPGSPAGQQVLGLHEYGLHVLSTKPGAVHVEPPADHRLDPRQRPPMVGPAVSYGALRQLRFQPREPGPAQPGQGAGPVETTPPAHRTGPGRVRQQHGLRGRLRPHVRLPLSRQVRRHRCTGRTPTRRFLAITMFGSPRANRSAASSRSRSRNSLSAVSPPPCAYRIPTAQRRDQEPSAPHDTMSSSSVGTAIGTATPPGRGLIPAAPLSESSRVLSGTRSWMTVSPVPVVAAGICAAGVSPVREPRRLLPSTASVSAPVGSHPRGQ